MRRLHTDYVNAITQEIELCKHKNSTVIHEESDSTRCTPTTAILPTHVIHNETNVMHKAWICETTTQPTIWITRYGWKLGCSIHISLFGMPTSYSWRDVRKKCLPVEKPPARRNSLKMILRPRHHHLPARNTMISVAKAHGIERDTRLSETEGIKVSSPASSPRQRSGFACAYDTHMD